MIRGTVNVIEKSLDCGYISNLPVYLSWLPSVAPSFSIGGDQVSIINRPQDFYTTLIDQCRSSKKRIALASLYLGTGPLEKQLVEELEIQLVKEEDLEVSILLDANRGSRGHINNSRKMLLPLLNNHFENCQVSLFHTPMLRGPLRYILPQRYNELVGLQHMKLYLFDDSVIISGANLSEDYFTNRQDRYILVSDCKPLADFYWGLVQRVSNISLALDASDNIRPRSQHPYKTWKKTYIAEAKDKVWGFYRNFINERNSKLNKDHDTWIFPLIELPPLDIHHDSWITSQLLECGPAGSLVTLSTGYFNLTQEYSDVILFKSLSTFRILMAHPTANGFLKAGGLAKGIPGAYTGLAQQFLRRVTEENNESERITMHEWKRDGWTYHAKGLWLTAPSDSAPSLTLIGSSNFGARSVSRDLESQVAIVTLNVGLKERLKEEEKRLLDNSVPFTLDVAKEPDRRPPLWVQTTLTLFKTFF